MQFSVEAHLFWFGSLKKIKRYYIKEIQFNKYVERFYNEIFLEEIFRVGLAHLAIMGEPPL